MTDTIRFDVVGLPAAQGSRLPIRAKSGRIVGHRETSKNHAPWRTAVAHAAKAAADQLLAPLDGPLMLHVDFRFAMPKARPKRIRERGWNLKTSAPDIDKLLRALGDGLTAGGLITDDARIVTVTAAKYEVVGWTGATVRIEPALWEPAP